MKEPLHLGDGAYVSVGRYGGEVVITANDDNPDFATDRVYLDPNAVKSLLWWLQQEETDER